MSPSYAEISRLQNFGSAISQVGISGVTACECPPPCPACGGLECLCRPRFFPGQVLTDNDLNRLENYVVAKNRLHNRHFHGAGVVCGLEVECDECNSGNVIVKTGYALSPCGDDVIVCRDSSVNVCELINRCKPKRDDCDPYGYQQPRECREGTQRWVLSICYDEKPARGVQPLVSEPCSCNGSCGCGGNGDCSCGGAAVTTVPKISAKSMKAGAGKYNPQCEPTQICESFRFTASRYVDPQARDPSDLAKYGVWGLIAAKGQQFGPLLTRLVICYLKAVELTETHSTKGLDLNANDQAAIERAAILYSEYHSALSEFARQHAVHRCELMRKLICLEEPVAYTDMVGETRRPMQVDWPSKFKLLNQLLAEAFRDCLCSVLLPPCPGPEMRNCVPLAVVTVDVDNCRVIEICNWSAREFALTLPTLYYWTSFIQWQAIKDVIAKLCCGPAALSPLVTGMLRSIVSSNAIGQQASVTTDVKMPTEMESFAMAAKPTDAQGEAVPSQPSGTLETLLARVEQAAMPDGMARLLAITQPQTAQATADVADLQRTVSDLQQKVQALQERINTQNK